jgi:hypothetical protein
MSPWHGLIEESFLMSDNLCWAHETSTEIEPIYLQLHQTYEKKGHSQDNNRDKSNYRVKN